ncbi:MAG TPA: PDZ domain-containing protein, partial [Pyrinomonadaceae bacterium]
MVQREQPPAGGARQDTESAQDRTCPNCGALMPGQMRFCRQCGYRLGEGVDEYVETRRFEPRDAKVFGSVSPPRTDAPPKPQPNLNSFVDQPPHAPLAGRQAFANQTSRELTLPPAKPVTKFPRWAIWLIIVIALTTGAFGTLVSTIKKNRRPGVKITIPKVPVPPGASEGSFVGADVKNADGGGVVFDYVKTPGSAADKAGLVGGDIITSFDGKAVRNLGQFRDLLAQTPPGKTVEVIYARDGETRTTKLTTVSEAENERLAELADNRPEGKGFIGEGTDLDRVQVPGTKIYGVRLNEIRRNNPAEIAGLRDGDIVIEFGGVPIRTRREFELRIE